jgi:hypothetical protein
MYPTPSCQHAHDSSPNPRHSEMAWDRQPEDAFRRVSVLAARPVSRVSTPLHEQQKQLHLKKTSSISNFDTPATCKVELNQAGTAIDDRKQSAICANNVVR